MRKLHTKGLLMPLLAAFFFIQSSGHAQSANDWSKEKATAWYTSKVWLNGLQATPADVVNYQEFAKQYQANKPAWDKAFAFLRDTDFTRLKIGRYPIDDENVYAIISEGPPREISRSKWEAHHTYNDIHFVVKGKEQIGIMPLANAPVAEEFSDAKDIGFYTIDNGNFYIAEPGNFYIMTTKDAHNPSNKVAGYDGVKKVVVKVRNAR
jgi:biofilm protein TabA